MELLEYRSRNFVVKGMLRKNEAEDGGMRLQMKTEKMSGAPGKLSPADGIFSYKIPPRGVECERNE